MERSGIPTQMGGINFRSRLEAKWANVFTALGWDWSYEPFDLPGWVPDFLIRCEGKRDLLIDIKPIARFDVEPLELFEKMERAADGQPYNLAVLGIEPVANDEGCLIGWMKADFGYEEPWDWCRLVSVRKDQIGVNQVQFSWCDFITGEHCKYGLWPDHEKFVASVFSTALNAVQWNRKKPSHIADVIAGIRL